MITSFLFQVFRAFADALLPPIFFAGLGVITDRLLHFELRTLSRLCLYIFSPEHLFSNFFVIAPRPVPCPAVRRLAASARGLLRLAFSALLEWSSSIRLSEIDSAMAGPLLVTPLGGSNVGVLYERGFQQDIENITFASVRT